MVNARLFGCGTAIGRSTNLFLLISGGPLRAERTKQQARHDSFPGTQRRQCADQGKHGVGTLVDEIGVAELAKRNLVRPARPKRHGPRLLVFTHAQGIVPCGDQFDAGLGIMHGDLAAYHLRVQTTHEEPNPVSVANQFEGEGLRHGDRLEQVLDTEHGAFAGARGRNRQAGLGHPSFAIRLST